MFSLQYGFGIAASQTLAAVTLAEFFELLNGKVPTTGVLRSSPFAKIVGIGSPDFSGLSSAHFLLRTICPLPTSSCTQISLLCVLPGVSTHLDPMGQVCPGFLILSVLL